jgi:hypothetical protein
MQTAEQSPSVAQEPSAAFTRQELETIAWMTSSTLHEGKPLRQFATILYHLLERLRINPNFTWGEVITHSVTAPLVHSYKEAYGQRGQQALELLEVALAQYSIQREGALQWEHQLREDPEATLQQIQEQVTLPEDLHLRPAQVFFRYHVCAIVVPGKVPHVLDHLQRTTGQNPQANQNVLAFYTSEYHLFQNGVMIPVVILDDELYFDHELTHALFMQFQQRKPFVSITTPEQTLSITEITTQDIWQEMKDQGVAPTNAAEVRSFLVAKWQQYLRSYQDMRRQELSCEVISVDKEDTQQALKRTVQAVVSPQGRHSRYNQLEMDGFLACLQRCQLSTADKMSIWAELEKQNYIFERRHRVFGQLSEEMLGQSENEPLHFLANSLVIPKNRYQAIGAMVSDNSPELRQEFRSGRLGKLEEIDLFFTMYQHYQQEQGNFSIEQKAQTQADDLSFILPRLLKRNFPVILEYLQGPMTPDSRATLQPMFAELYSQHTFPIYVQTIQEQLEQLRGFYELVNSQGTLTRLRTRNIKAEVERQMGNFTWSGIAEHLSLLVQGHKSRHEDQLPEEFECYQEKIAYLFSKPPDEGPNHLNEAAWMPTELIEQQRTLLKDLWSQFT